ncbi:hypothetical protein K502DRAFT_341678 [Neoconidiobolus thromboides FSU 785]|nr:hypothetical protein K502DRAFT_341678 [Neoconidiobolus thromboides FSU 785]
MNHLNLNLNLMEYNHQPFLNSLNNNEHHHPGNFTPPVYMIDNTLFSPVVNPYINKFWSLPNSGHLNMLNNFNLQKDIPDIDLKDNNVPIATYDEDITISELNANIINNLNNQDITIKSTDLNVNNNIELDQTVNSINNHNDHMSVNGNIIATNMASIQNKTKSIITPLNLMSSRLSNGTGLDIKENITAEPFIANPLSTSKLKAVIPPVIPEDDVESIGNPQGNKGKNETSQIPTKDQEIKKRYPTNRRRPSNHRPLISPAIMPAGVNTNLSATQLSTKSNYQLIVEGNSAALGLNYAPSFEQIVKRKRLVHQASEQKRRAALTAMFKELANVLKDCSGEEKVQSQSSILNGACEILLKQEEEYFVKAEMLKKLKRKFGIEEDCNEFPRVPNTLAKLNYNPS